jgi:hypothetical protein
MATVYLKDGESVTISGLPYGYSYDIVENSSDLSMETTATGGDYYVNERRTRGTKIGVANTTVEYVNKHAASLTLTKEVVGTDADKQQNYYFYVFLMNSDGDPYPGRVYMTYSDSPYTYYTYFSYTQNPYDYDDSTGTYPYWGYTGIMLQGGESVTLYGLPAGGKYAIFERDPGCTFTTDISSSSSTAEITTGLKYLVEKDIEGDSNVVYTNTDHTETKELTISKTVDSSTSDKKYKEYAFEIQLYRYNSYSGYTAITNSDGLTFTGSAADGADLPLTDNIKIISASYSYYGTIGITRIYLKDGQSVTIGGLPYGYSYSVTEVLSTDDAANYTTTINGTASSSRSVSGSKTTADSLTWNYKNTAATQPGTETLTLSKDVDSIRTADRNTEFTFVVQLYTVSSHYSIPSSSATRYETLYTPITDVQVTGSSTQSGVDPPDVSSVSFQTTTESGMTGSIATATITLKHGQSITLSNLPVGFCYRITEEGADGFDDPEITVTDSTDTTPTYTASGLQVSQSQVTADSTSVHYQNIKTSVEIVPATGIRTDVLPYAIMIAFSACFGILLTIHRRKHGSARGR